MECDSPASIVDRWAIRQAEIIQIHSEIDRVSTYRLQLEDGLLHFLPGQFQMLYVPGVGEAAISFSGGDPDGEWFDHTVRVVGNVTGQLARMDVGDTIGIRGPFGSCWPIEQSVGGDVVIVAGGIGLAPLKPVIETIARRRDEFGSVTVLSGARNPDGLLYMQLIDRWLQAGIDVQIIVDRGETGWRGHVGVVPQLLDRLPLLSPENTNIMCCGPDVMMWYTARSAMGKGIPEDRIWISLERNMSCAFGHCGHCQFGPFFVCKDGPVVRFSQVAPFLRVEGL